MMQIHATQMTEQCQPLLSKDTESAEDSYTKYGTHERIKDRVQGWIPWLKNKYHVLINNDKEPTVKELQLELNLCMCFLIFTCLAHLFFLYRYYSMHNDVDIVQINSGKPLDYPMLIIDADDTFDLAINKPLKVLQRIK